MESPPLDKLAQLDRLARCLAQVAPPDSFAGKALAELWTACLQGNDPRQALGRLHGMAELAWGMWALPEAGAVPRTEQATALPLDDVTPELAEFQIKRLDFGLGMIAPGGTAVQQYLRDLMVACQEGTSTTEPLLHLQAMFADRPEHAEAYANPRSLGEPDRYSSGLTGALARYFAI